MIDINKIAGPTGKQPGSCKPDPNFGAIIYKLPIAFWFSFTWLPCRKLTYLQEACAAWQLKLEDLLAADTTRREECGCLNEAS